MTECKGRKRGFTIVELLAVIVLMAIVTVIGFVGVRTLLKSGKQQTMVTKTELVLKNAVSLADETTTMFNGCYCKIDNKWKDCRVITVQDLIDNGSYTTTEKCENNTDCIKNDLYDFRGDSDVEFKEESLNNEKIVLYKRNNQYVAEFATSMEDETLRSQGCSYSNIKASEIKLSAPSATVTKQYVSLDHNILYYADDIYYSLKFESGLPVTSIKYCLTTGESCDQFNKTIVAKPNQYTYTGKIDIKVSNPVRICVQALDELRKVTTGCSDLFYYDPSKIETLDVSTPRCYVNGAISTENCPVTGTNRYIADYVTTDFSSTKERSKYNFYKKVSIENSAPNNFEVSINSKGNETNRDGKYLNEFTQPNRDDINGTITVRTPGGQEYKPLKYDITNTVMDTSEHKIVNSRMPEMNVTVKYKVIYDPNGGTGTMTPSIFRYYKTENLTKNTFTRIGYTYKGWSKQKSGNLEANSGVNYSNGTVDEVTMYAQWEANKYTVTFNANNGNTPNPKSKIVTFDSAYGTLATISRTGYTFAGWWTAASGGTQITASTIVKTPNDHTLYAHWTANKYTVTFDRNTGDTPSPTTKVVTFDSKYGDLATITKTGYTFAGWWTAASGGTQITKDTIVKTPNNHTLYAHWTPNKYTVTFNANNGNTPNPQTKVVTFDSEYGTLATVTRTGYTFAGWYTAASGGSKTDTNTIVKTPNNHTLYAHWTPNKYTITLTNSLATTNGTTSVTATYDSATLSSGITNPKRIYTITFKPGTPAATLSATSATSTWTFTGWWTAASGGTKVIGTDGKLIASVSGYTNASKQWVKAGNATLYAQWSGGTISIPTATRTGYTCTLPTITNPPTANATYTATCTANKYTITLTNSLATTNGTTSVKATFDSASLSATITNPKRVYTITFKPGTPAATLSATSATSTWTFTGWWTATSGGSKIIGTDGKLIASVSGYTNASKQWVKAGNATLYAQWSGGKITVPTPTRTGYTCTLPTVTNPPTANATYTATCIDNYPPTITCAKSNTGTTAGVTVTCTCKDNGSGVTNCAGKTVTATASTTETKTGVKSSQTYTVKDASGNTASTTVTVTAQGQIRTKSCTAGNRCSAAGCQTWKNCAHSECGVASYNRCASAGCEVYNSCAHSECGCKAWNSCANSACGVASYKRCASAGCETYKSCATAACGCAAWNSCATSACGVSTYKRCSAAGCETYKSCSSSSCGCQTYYSCTNSACGCGTWTATYRCTKSNGSSSSGTAGTGSTKAYAENYCASANSGCCSTQNGGCKSFSCSASCTAYSSCRTSACGCQTYKTCQTSACGCQTYKRGSQCGVESYKTCATSDCGCKTYSTCRDTACGCETYKRGSVCGVESYNTCATSGCGCKTWNTCATSGCGCKTYKRGSVCGVESYNTCRTSGCGCETYNQNIAKCGCSAWSGWSAWTNSNSCTAGESSNHSTTTECRTLYS